MKSQSSVVIFHSWHPQARALTPSFVAVYSRNVFSRGDTRAGFGQTLKTGILWTSKCPWVSCCVSVCSPRGVQISSTQVSGAPLVLCEQHGFPRAPATILQADELESGWVSALTGLTTCFSEGAAPWGMTRHQKSSSLLTSVIPVCILVTRQSHCLTPLCSLLFCVWHWMGSYTCGKTALLSPVLVTSGNKSGSGLRSSSAGHSSQWVSSSREKKKKLVH